MASKPEPVRLAFRGFVRGEVQFEEFVELPEDDLPALLPGLAARHADAMASNALHMIEVEFLDEPDQNERFFRFGADPSRMVMPMAIPLDELSVQFREDSGDDATATQACQPSSGGASCGKS